MFHRLDDRVLLCLLYEWKLGNSPRTAYENLNRVYGPGTITEGTTAKWYGRFRSGRHNLERKTKTGVTRVVDEDELEQTLKENPDLTIAELAKKFGVSMTTIWKHLKLISKGQKMTFIDFKKPEQVSFILRLISI
ncbi:hypothetical protein COOONC_15492 [Cooperia oncophora]